MILQTRRMKLNNEEPSEFDEDLLKLCHEIIKAVNDLRGRVLVLEGAVFNG